MTTEAPAAPKRAAKAAAAKPASAKPTAAKPVAAKPAATKAAAAKTASPKKPAAAKAPAARKAPAKPAAAKAASPRKPAVRKPAPVVVPPPTFGEEMKAIATEGAALASTAAAVVTKTLALKKKELVDRVAALSGGKKKSVRDVVEATLSVLGEALEKGEELILPPFGKAKVNRSKDGAAGSKLLTVKLRRGESRAAKQPLAEDEE